MNTAPQPPCARAALGEGGGNGFSGHVRVRVRACVYVYVSCAYVWEELNCPMKTSKGTNTKLGQRLTSAHRSEGAAVAAALRGRELADPHRDRGQGWDSSSLAWAPGELLGTPAEGGWGFPWVLDFRMSSPVAARSAGTRGALALPAQASYKSGLTDDVKLMC